MPDNEIDDNFFEEDEAVEDVVAAFESGEHGITNPPLLQISLVTQSLNTGLVHYETQAVYVTEVQSTPIPISA